MPDGGGAERGEERSSADLAGALGRGSTAAGTGANGAGACSAASPGAAMGSEPASKAAYCAVARRRRRRMTSSAAPAIRRTATARPSQSSGDGLLDRARAFSMA